MTELAGCMSVTALMECPGYSKKSKLQVSMYLALQLLPILTWSTLYLHDEKNLDVECYTKLTLITVTGHPCLRSLPPLGGISWFPIPY